jgi:O-antigen ligase
MCIVILWSLYRLLSQNGFAGPFPNINTLGNYANIILPVALYRVFREHESPWTAVGDSLLFWGALAVLFMSLTSSSWMTGVFQLALFIVLARPPLKKASRVLGFAAGVLALSAFAFVYWHGFFGERLVMEWQQLASLDDPVRFTNNRWTIWKGTIEAIRIKPFAGWGWGAFKEAWMAFNQPIPFLGYPSHAHNMYLGLLASGGVVLLASFLSLFGLGLSRAWQVRGLFSAEEGPLVSSAFFTAIAGQLVLGIGGGIFEARHSGGFLFWCLMGVALALGSKETAGARKSTGSDPKSTGS